MTNAHLPPVASPENLPPTEQAAEALRGWLDAGERIAVLLAPRGAARHEALARLERSLEGRFLAERWSAAQGNATPPSTLEELRGRRTLAIVESGEELGAEGARALRASLEDPAGVRCAVIALAADEAGAVLPALGPGIEVVVLRAARGGTAPAPARTLRAGGAALLAAASIALASLLVLPRLAEEAVEPAPVAATVPPPVAAAPPAEPLPVAAVAPLAGSARAPEPTPKAVAAERAAPAPRRPVAPPPPERAAPVPSTARTAAAPAPADGWLVVNAIPRAKIHLDGAAIGTTPIVRHRVTAGEHRVIAHFDDGRADERTIRVAGGELYLMFDGR